MITLHRNITRHCVRRDRYEVWRTFHPPGEAEIVTYVYGGALAGEATLHDVMMTRGDGGGVTIQPSVSLTARENAEILVVDLGPASRVSASGIVP